MLRAERLTLSVPGRVLVSGLDVSFGAGECWAVLGRNGSGKTTLMHALAGLNRPASGGISLAGRALGALSRRELAAQIGLLPQEEPAAFYGTVCEYVMLPRQLRGDSPDEAARVATAALAQLGLETLAGARFADISGGECQRARLAQLLAQDPAIYLLDEPLLHLDVCHRRTVLRLFADLARVRRRAVIAVLHDPAAALRWCDSVLMLHGTGPTQIAAARAVTPEMLAALFGCEAVE